jgi:hypothetical protein
MTIVYYSIKRTDWNRGRWGFFVTQLQRMYWVEERSVATLYTLEAVLAATRKVVSWDGTQISSSIITIDAQVLEGDCHDA